MTSTSNRLIAIPLSLGMSQKRRQEVGERSVMRGGSGISGAAAINL